MQKHAKLSASGSHRWILCPGSVKAEEKFPDIRNKYTEEGVLAHEIAAAILNKEDISGFEISSEMQENIKIYTMKAIAILIIVVITAAVVLLMREIGKIPKKPFDNK